MRADSRQLLLSEVVPVLSSVGLVVGGAGAWVGWLLSRGGLPSCLGSWSRLLVRVKDVLRSALKDLFAVGTSPRVMLMSSPCMSHDVIHGRGEVCGANGIEICLMRLLSGWFVDVI